ncbi:MAG: hypothetical protein M3391_08665, partial [Actinomycetota bacterium]|nr:hypothetical protein [Actinomycetota bacterium]
ARVFGDTVEGTGEETGLDLASKKGDFVVTVNPQDVGDAEVRIVVEAKSASLTVPQLLNELDQGRQNRMALEAIIVFDARKAPAQVGALRHYPGRGIACSVDPDSMEMLPLEVAYKLARINALLEARALQFGDVKLDTVRLAELMQQATTSVRRFSQIRSSLTKASNNLSEIADAVSDAQEDTQRALVLLAATTGCA